MKNVVFLIKDAYNQGGDTRVISLIANELSKENNVQILSIFGSENKTKFKFDNRLNIINIFKEGPFDLRKNYFRARKKILKNIKKIDIDYLIIAAMDLPIFLYPNIAKFNFKIIVWEHASLSNGGKTFGLSWSGRRVAVKFSDAIVVITKKDYQDYTNKFKKAKKIVQIYNPMDPEIKTTVKYNQQSKKIIAVGRLVHDKGFDYLIEVMNIVNKHKPDWELHIYGEGYMREQLENMILINGLEKNVLLKGEVNNIYELYRNYSIYALSSRTESFGMVIIEALLNKIPVISFDCDNGPREIIIDGLNGYLIKNFDIMKMASQIIFLIENIEVRNQMSIDTNTNLDKFNIKKISNEWSRLLNEINEKE